MHVNMFIINKIIHQTKYVQFSEYTSIYTLNILVDFQIKDTYTSLKTR